MKDKPETPRSKQNAPTGGKGHSPASGELKKVSSEEIEQIVSQQRPCKACGKDLSLTNGEVRFYLSHGLQIPKRCKECREKSREESATPKSMQNTFFTNNDTARIPMVPWRHI